MRAIFGNSCAKGCFTLGILFVLVVVVTTVGLGGLGAKFGAAEIQGLKPGTVAQGNNQSAVVTQPQSQPNVPADNSIMPDGTGGGSAPASTAVSAPPPPITQTGPEPQPQSQPTTIAPQSVESQGGTITGESLAPFYIVQPGDSVWQIAHKFGVDMDEIRNLNSIEGNLIYPGQVVYLPDAASPPTGVGPDSVSGDTGQDPLIPTMPNTGITSKRP